MLFYQYRRRKRVKNRRRSHSQRVQRMHSHKKPLRFHRVHHRHQINKIQHWNSWHLYHHVSALLPKDDSHYRFRVHNQVPSLKKRLKMAPSAHARAEIIKSHNQIMINRRKLQSLLSRRPQSRAAKHSQKSASAAPSSSSASHDSISKQDLIREIHHINSRLDQMSHASAASRTHQSRRSLLVVHNHPGSKLASLTPRTRSRTDSDRLHTVHSWLKVFNCLIFAVLVIVLLVMAYFIIIR